MHIYIYIFTTINTIYTIATVTIVYYTYLSTHHIMLLWKEHDDKPSAETVHQVSATLKRCVVKWDQF